MQVFVVMSQRSENLWHVVVVQAVVRVAAAAPHHDKPVLAQKPKLVRDGAWRDAGALGDLFHPQLAVDQQPKHAQAAGRAERPHRLCERLGLLL